MRTGNILRSAHICGKDGKWTVSVGITAVNDEAYEKAKQTIREMVNDENQMQMWALPNTPNVRSD